MKISHLKSMKRGWFVGDFEPTIYSTNDCEVAVKSYNAGEHEESHYHKVATEITVIVTGRVRMFDMEFHEGDIIVAEPGEVTDFTALTECVNVVVKLPGANNDKYAI
ncbi:hypothetical protein SAMN05216582_12223 [Selenomonas ruminantium]|uniref:Cupin domain-containing protein n=1 Tax=Selenomonas ruminantium TaxID=971 RepID=A0A1M6W377_SELRU|nr:hypothetical protein [Selenomonas ruminantium]SHK88098.1 hypothetical protein SAMN05216582_12223 [Selenomonas ruminantium]